MSTSNSSRKFLIILFILGAFLRLYRIGEIFSFDFDQEVAANAAYNFIKLGKLSLIGQELSFQGFFLGPIHNWTQIIPYSVCNLKPDCVPYFFTSIGLITGYFLYMTVRKIINRKTAVISTIFYLISSVVIGNERGPTSNYFLLPTSIFMLYCLNKYYQGAKLYLIAGSFFGGLATVNFNPIFIFTLFAYFLGSLLGRKKEMKLLIISFFAALINVFPLLIFNLRHQNLLLNNFVKFLTETNSTENIFSKPFFLAYNILIPYYNHFLFLNNNIIYKILTFCILAFGSYLILKSRKPILIFLLIWILCVLFGFTFYNRHIPDYYFVQTLLPFILVISYLFSKKFLLFILITFMFSYSNLLHLSTFNSPINYKLKKDVVNFVLSDTKEEDFNVYYNFPLGLNNGYAYLFKAAGRDPIDYSKNLYILDLFQGDKFEIKDYYKTFNDKIKGVSAIGIMRIIKIRH